MPETGNFRRGAQAAAEASKGGQFARTEYFRLEDGHEALIRLLTPEQDWIIVDQHSMVPTKPKPDDYKGEKWPEKMGAVCRNDVAFEGKYQCYICEFLVDGTKVRKASSRVWALAVLREEVLGDGSPELGGPEMKGKKFGTRDMTREVVLPARDAEGDKPAQPERTIEEKAIVIVNLGYKNFFSILEGFAARWGSATDRDYHIRRVGNDQSTVYQIVPEDPIEVDGERLDPTNPKFAARWATDLDLAAEVTRLASDDYYARFFDPRVSVSEDGEVEETGEEAPTPDTEISQDQLAALKGRVRTYVDGPEAAANGGEETESKEEEPAATARVSTGAVDLG